MSAPVEENTFNVSLKEGVDYYIVHGYWVFTAHYLLKRGWCCGSGCRHCPYGRQQGSTEPLPSSTLPKLPTP